MHIQETFRRGSIPFILLAAALFACTSGCQSTRKGPVTPGLPPGSPANVPVTLAAGDIVRLTFPGAPELNQAQKIRADGGISLPMVGEVIAAGKRPLELQTQLKALYAPQLQNSEVVVTLESGAVPVYLSGAVGKPGRMVFDRPTNVLEVITQAGGFSPRANIRKVRVIRLINGKHQSQIIDLKSALEGRTVDAFYVRPNDVIHVEENLLNF